MEGLVTSTEAVQLGTPMAAYIFIPISLNLTNGKFQIQSWTGPFDKSAVQRLKMALSTQDLVVCPNCINSQLYSYTV